MAGRKKGGRLGVGIIAVIVTFIIGIIAIKTNELREILDSRRNELENINDSIEDAKEDTKDIRTELKYRQTDDYIEDKARDIGLRYPDEIVILPEEEEK